MNKHLLVITVGIIHVLGWTTLSFHKKSTKVMTRQHLQVHTQVISQHSQSIAIETTEPPDKKQQKKQLITSPKKTSKPKKNDKQKQKKPSKNHSTRAPTTTSSSSPSVDNNDLFFTEIMYRFKELLSLPEAGAVKGLITVDSKGRITKVEILSSESKKNSEYLQITLPSVILPARSDKNEIRFSVLFSGVP